MTAARKRGKHIGRPRKLASKLIEDVRLLKHSQKTAHDTLCANFGISSRTLSRALNEYRRLAV